jgi:pantoate kinase
MIKRGSRGCGICLTLGVNTEVQAESSEKQNIEIFINGQIDAGPVTRLAAMWIIGDDPWDVKVISTLDLPQAQGFGMSGAGALSTCLALDEALNLGKSREELVSAAHQVEILCGTGLGDVMPQSVGGMVIRKKEGAPPFGELVKLETGDEEVVLCVVGEKLHTKDIIFDPVHKKTITECGQDCLSELSKSPSLEEMMRLSQSFSKKTNLMSPEVENAIKAAGEFGIASMSMLGNSVFAVGDTQNLVQTLVDFGEVYVCKIDNLGGRILKGE